MKQRKKNEGMLRVASEGVTIDSTKFLNRPLKAVHRQSSDSEEILGK